MTATPGDLDTTWTHITRELIDTSAYAAQQRAWLRVTRFTNLTGTVATLEAPSSYAQHALTGPLGTDVAAVLSRHLGYDVSLKISTAFAN